MYSRAESTKLKEEFWTTYGKYLAPLPNSEGRKINWVNYHTGYKNLFFRMMADGKRAIIGIYISHPDPLTRALFYDKFLSFRPIFNSYAGDDWIWDPEFADTQAGPGARIYKELSNTSVFDRNEWPKLISFFKPRIIALDEFWNDVKDGFEELRML